MNLSILYKKLTNRKHTIWYKFILSLFVWFVWIISFCNAISFQNSFYCPANWYCDAKFNIENIWDLKIKTTYGNNSYKVYYYSSMYWSIENTRITIWDFDSSLWVKHYVSRAEENDYFVYVQLTNPCWWNSCTVDYTYIISWWSASCPECPTCDPQYTSEQCQSVYWLVSSWQFNSCNSNLNSCQTDLNSCQSNTSWFNDLLNNCSNNLNACNNSLTNCLQQNCPETVTGTNRSSLFINNIQYPWAPTIKFTIPEEIEREQNTDEEETNIDVIWYWYDQDKMQQMVNTQYYKPTAEEMSWLMEKVADFLPLVWIALLITRIRRVIKKVF